MKKFIYAMAVTLLGLFATTESHAQAPNNDYETKTCNVNCLWSSCTIEVSIKKGSGGGVACGCYFGIAMCKSDNGGSSENIQWETKTVEVYAAPISNAVNYFNGLSNAAEFVNVVNVLNTFYTGMSASEYNISMDDYESAVEGLSPSNQAIVSSYVDSQ